MNTSSMMNEINLRVKNALKENMTVPEVKALRAEITDSVIRERAKQAKADVEKVIARWDEAIRTGQSLYDVEKEFNL